MYCKFFSKKIRIRVDPDPQHWTKYQYLFHRKVNQFFLSLTLPARWVCGTNRARDLEWMGPGSPQSYLIEVDGGAPCKGEYRVRDPTVLKAGPWITTLLPDRSGWWCSLRRWVQGPWPYWKRGPGSPQTARPTGAATQPHLDHENKELNTIIKLWRQLILTTQEYNYDQIRI